MTTTNTKREQIPAETGSKGKKRVKVIPEPSWMRTARAVYGGSFDRDGKAAIEEAATEWARELSPGARDFAIAHLLYLNLVAQARGQRAGRVLLRHGIEEITGAVDQLAEVVEDAVELRATETQAVRDEDSEDRGGMDASAGSTLEAPSATGTSQLADAPPVVR